MTEDEHRFAAKVDRSNGPDACWLWIEAVTVAMQDAWHEVEAIGAPVGTPEPPSDPEEACPEFTHIGYCPYQECENGCKHAGVPTREQIATEMFDRWQDCPPDKNLWHYVADAVLALFSQPPDPKAAFYERERLAWQRGVMAFVDACCPTYSTEAANGPADLLPALEDAAAELLRLRGSQPSAEREVLSIDEHGEEAALGRDFYRCPNTGRWVYRWIDERVIADPPPPEPERNGSFAVGQCCSGCSNPNCPDCGEGIARGDEWMQRQAAADPPVVPAHPHTPDRRNRCPVCCEPWPCIVEDERRIIEAAAAASPTVLVELPREVVERYARNHEDVFHPTDYPLVCAAARDALAEKEDR